MQLVDDQLDEVEVVVLSGTGLLTLVSFHNMYAAVSSGVNLLLNSATCAL